MGRTRIGLDIGTTAVRAAELSMRSVPPALIRVAEVPLPDGAVSNGEVRDPAAVSAAVRELWQLGRFRSREVILGVANQRVVVREVAVPWLAEKELRQSLPFLVQEFVPIPMDEAVLDYHVLEEFEHEGRRMLRLLLVAAYKSMVRQVVQAVEGAKLTPTGVDLVPFAIVRSVGSIDNGSFDEAMIGDEALVEIGAEVTSICVHAWGVPRFVRILPSGARMLGETASEAEEFAEVSSTPDGHDIFGGPKRGQTTKIEDRRAAAFADDIHSSLEFYLSQMPGSRISRVLLSGGGSKLPGLMELLAERVPGQVVPGRAFHRVAVAADLSDESIEQTEPYLAVAVGLALPGVRG
jgi:type IV pilus assembly protein PilM